jgi:hypothetical protein
MVKQAVWFAKKLPSKLFAAGFVNEGFTPLARKITRSSGLSCRFSFEPGGDMIQ